MKCKPIYVCTCLVMGVFACNNQENVQKEIPVTTSSDEAHEVFIEARNHWELWEDNQAAVLFDSAIALDPEFAMAYFYRAFSGGGANVFNEHIEKAAALADNISPGEQLLVEIAMSRLEQRGAEMKVLTDSLLRMYPEDKRLYLFLGGWNLNSDEDEQLAYYKKAFALDSNFFPVYPYLIDHYIDEKEYGTARIYAEKFIENLPESPEGYRRMGILERYLGNDQEALEMLKKSAEIQHTPYIETTIGQTYILQKEYEKAREHFSKNLNKNEQLSTRLNALWNIGVSYLYERNEEKALQSFAEMRTLAEEEGVNTSVVWSYLYQAQTVFMFKDYEKMSDYLDPAEKAIQNLDFEARSRRNLQKILLRYRGLEAIGMDDLEAAGNYYDEFKSRTKDNGIAADAKASNFDQGYLAYNRGNYEKAVERYKKAFEGIFADYFLALAYLDMGEPDQARPLLENVAASRDVGMNNAFLVDWAKEKLEELETS